jgi:hypothetical protein
MAKDVKFGVRPGKPETPKPAEAALNDWVEDKPKLEETFRMTVDIPVSLHTRLKQEATSRRLKLREYLIEIINEHWKNIR